MTRPASANPWAKPAFLVLLLGVLVLAVMQLAGILFSSFTHAARLEDIRPYTIYQYWYWYGSHTQWRDDLITSSVLSFSALLLPLALIFKPTPRKLHGDARWASSSEIRGAGLLDHDGIIMGKRRGKFLLFDGAEQGKNVIVSASPGSGKTQGLMIPNCLNWPGSLVALDMKGECYERTSGFRQSMGQKVYQLNFLARDYHTHQYDPFAYVSEDRHFRVSDIEKIARYLCPDPSHGDTFWATGAREMFRSIALFLFETGQQCTLGAILDVIEIPEGIQKFAKRMVKDAQEGIIALDSATVRDFATIGNRAENTHSGVKDQITNALAPLKNPIVRFATSANTFNICEIRNQPISIYITAARPDLIALRPIINLFFQHLVDLNSMKEFGKHPSHKHEVLLAMDEFAQIGRLEAIFHGITYFRSFGIRLLAIVQSVSQLRETYSIESTKTFLESFDCSVFFTPAARDSQTPKELSDLLGMETVKSKSQSKRNGFDTNNDSETHSEQGRPLMMPQEISRMSLTKQIVLISGQHPIFCNKIIAWKEKAFLSRNGVAPIAPKMGTVETPVSLPNAIEETAAVATRVAEVADMSTIEELSLEDFSCDFSAIEAPKGKMTETEIEHLRDVFLNTLVRSV
ncbi:type IV secretory system conjugative DNA transfer family protein [Sulfurirhabdus autotrophica]|uniref:Type IV secretion system protein VirD4 n=1 Tax=Sulfurirhabdus autotrophica TaxID=1706046 RepID=A0A4V2W173_9PROT|nr:type IV secretory system conjugative DNA transfer family protein [Sulfurirhabdus autotrophica]TCV82729.1 type IV secretion system protein VirD4 [Sulfurirhabdus autotrophica]